MPRDSIGNILRVSILLCLACSIAVSVAAVGLRDRQEANAKRDQQKNVLLASGNFEPEDLTPEIVASEFENHITTHWIELGTGQEIPVSELPDGEKYDPRAAAGKSETQVTLDPEIASNLGIKTLAPYYAVYEIRNEQGLDCLVLPIIGKGLWSTMYGFLALEPDMRTVRGINFYEHGETPGLGGEITNDRWKAIWPGKVAFDESGTPQINVVKGSVNQNNPDANHQIDGLAGATITSNGVEDAVNFWLSDNGLGKFLDQLNH